MSVHLSWTTGRILQEDVELLAAPHAWLNDSCVAYFMQWLSLALDLNTAPTSSTAAGFVLMDPCCGFMLQYEHDVEDIDLDSVNLDPANQFIFLPVNDGDICADSYSGTHWSLLVWAPYGKFYMFDSAGGAPNSPNVKSTAAGLAKYFLHNSSSDTKLQLPDHIAEVFRRPLEITLRSSTPLSFLTHRLFRKRYHSFVLYVDATYSPCFIWYNTSAISLSVLPLQPPFFCSGYPM